MTWRIRRVSERLRYHLIDHGLLSGANGGEGGGGRGGGVFLRHGQTDKASDSSVSAVCETFARSYLRVLHDLSIRVA